MQRFFREERGTARVRMYSGSTSTSGGFVGLLEEGGGGVGDEGEGDEKVGGRSLRRRSSDMACVSWVCVLDAKNIWVKLSQHEGKGEL